MPSIGDSVRGRVSVSSGPRNRALVVDGATSIGWLIATRAADTRGTTKDKYIDSDLACWPINSVYRGWLTATQLSSDSGACHE